MQTPQLRLLSVAIDDYCFLDPLESCVDGVSRTGRILRERYGLEQHNWRQLHNRDACSERIEHELQRYTKYGFDPLSDRDALIFYFSGHGSVCPANGFLIAPYEAKKNSVSTFFSFKLLEGYLAQIHAAQIWVVVDCCHAGFARPLKKRRA